MEEIKEQIYKILADELNIKEKVIFQDDILLIEDLGFDSMQLMSLIAELEDVFQIEFKDSDMLFDSFNRIGDLCELVNKLISKK